MAESKVLDLDHAKEVLFGKKGTTILLIVGFLGIALILISELWQPSGKKQASQSASAVSTETYSKQVESRLKGIIGQIDGVGRVQVMVTVQSGVQYIYEQSQKSTNDRSVNSQSDGSTQSQENNDSEQNPVVMDNGSGGQQALLKTELQPTVLGVVVVCDGGDNPVVQEQVVETVTTALDIPANHVSISRMTKKQ